MRYEAKLQQILADKAREEAAQAPKSPTAGALKDNENVADQAAADEEPKVNGEAEKLNPEKADLSGPGSAVKEEEEDVDDDIDMLR